MLEFNEICPSLIDKWMGEGKLPSFAAFHRSSEVFTTFADVSDPEYLEPWIQWYSIHTGLPYSEHKIFYLTDGPKADHLDIWHRLQMMGKTVMNFGSMNARALVGSDVFYLPDPWCSNEPAVPSEIEVFKELMARLIQENTKGIVLSPKELILLIRFLVYHGLAVDTVRAALTQLVGERISKSNRKWRRVALADRLQFDVFRHFYRRMRPDFATFFINSTAHLQHAYWRHMDPDAFALKPPKHELDTYGPAILFGYQAMDALLCRFMALADRETTIILCSALSQQPFLKREGRGGQHFYRLRDVAHFLRLVGIHPRLVEPVMTHQYLFRFNSCHEGEEALAVVNRIMLGNNRVFGATLSGSDMYIGCEVYEALRKDGEIEGISGCNDPIRFFDLFYTIDAVKSGRHHPEGVLWIRSGHHEVHAERVSILDIAPTIYDLMGVREMVDPGRAGGAGLLLNSDDGTRAALHIREPSAANASG
jgi:hypothetical protein